MSAKKTYSRPVIRRQYMGAANKFGGQAIPETVSEIDGVKVQDLIAKYGSPLFVFSEATMRRKVQELNRAFRTRYPQFQAAWSYKTNYLNAVCKVFHDEGSWAEVVSGYEYQKARKNGIPGNRIIFNGPYKRYPVLKQAVSEGARVHADNLDEIQDLLKIADELGRPVDLALRLNLDTGMYPAWSRFGFNLEAGHALEAARKIASSSDRLRLIGLHSHIGTFVQDTGPYKRAAKKIAEFYKKLRSELRQPLQYIDLGGGFASTNKLKAQYLSGPGLIPSFDSYAEAIAAGLYESFEPEEPPQLFLETGRALVDEAGYLISSVVANKTMANGYRTLVLDAGVNMLYTSTWYDPKISPAQDHPGAFEEVTLNGPLCMNIDVVRERCLLPNMPRGAAVVMHPVGAYNVTQWMQFIEMRPAIVMIRPDRTVVQIRRAETLDDMNSFEVQ